MTAGRSIARAVALGAVDAVAVWRLWPDLPGLRRNLSAPQAWVDRVGGDRAAMSLAGAALWLVGLWLAAGLVAAVTSYAPGAVGRAGRRAASAALPRVLHRAVAGAAGLGVLLTPVAALAQSSGAGPRPPVPAPVLPAPTLPTSTIPTPTLPSSLPAEPSARVRALPATSTTEVVVRSGDSLWSIASAHLPPGATDRQVAAEWPRWYAANRTEIGPNPDRITPGQALNAPSEQETP